MSNPEMNTAWQERVEKILNAWQDAKKSEWKLRETAYVNDGNWNFIETEIGDRRDERIEELEKRVEDLERLVDEIIQWKEDRVIIQIDKKWKESGYITHKYRCSRWETKEED